MSSGMTHASVRRANAPVNLPTGDIARLIHRDFGSFQQLICDWKFQASLLPALGSGWIWLILTRETPQRLQLLRSNLSEIPERLGAGRSLLACDVWEHSFLLDYRWDVNAYVDAWFQLVNWDFANLNLRRDIFTAGLTALAMTNSRL